MILKCDRNQEEFRRKTHECKTKPASVAAPLGFTLAFDCKGLAQQGKPDQSLVTDRRSF
jgi:hypothetical protein